MTKKDWSSIHGKVKEAESMKSHNDGVGSRMDIYIYMFMHCENKGLLNACMIENEMCVFA